MGLVSYGYSLDLFVTSALLEVGWPKLDRVNTSLVNSDQFMEKLWI